MDGWTGGRMGGAMIRMADLKGRNADGWTGGRKDGQVNRRKHGRMKDGTDIATRVRWEDGAWEFGSQVLRLRDTT